MDATVRTKAKYKQLRGAVQSYTQGFTSIMWPGFAGLASYAQRTNTNTFDIDFLGLSIFPQPDYSVCDGFFDYRDLREWFDDIGCSICHVRRFAMHVAFHLSTAKVHQYGTSRVNDMRFRAQTKLEDDRGTVYSYDHSDSVWFEPSYDK